MSGSPPDDGVVVERSGDFVTIWMNRAERRNALSLDQMRLLRRAFAEAGDSDALGVVLAGKGPVFSAGHDFEEIAGVDLPTVRKLLAACTDLMDTMQSIPQVVIARVHGLATAAGCQLVATCDLAVAAENAGFAAPGGRGGWFCTTPMVAIGRNLARKHALELALTGDTVDAATALQWGLVNRVVPSAELDDATFELLGRATRGSALSKGLGKQAFYRQIGLDQPEAYSYAMEVMAAASQTDDAQEGVAAFLEKRTAQFGKSRLRKGASD